MPSGLPLSVHLVPAAFHDLTRLHELAVVVPPGARLFGDKAEDSALDEASLLEQTGVGLIPVRRSKMQPYDWFVDESELRDYRHLYEQI
jgi:hypothetical protein